MPLVAATRTPRDLGITHLPESNAVGETGRSMRTSSETDLSNLLMASIFWKRTCQLQATYSRVFELSKLKSNWDSYGAPSPNRESINNALRILRFVEPSDLEILDIVPSAEGGIGFCFRHDNRYADLEAMNDGSILGVRYAGMETPVLITVDGSDRSLGASMEEIRNHIGT